jgi:Glycosyltransferase family 87
MESSVLERDSGHMTGRFNPARRLRIAICVCAAVLLALLWSYVSLLVSGKVHIQQSDFTVYFAAAHLVAMGHGGEIYSFPVLATEQHRLFHSLLLPRSEAVFLYPPFVAVALVPLTGLSYEAAYALWSLLNIVLLVAVLRILQRYLQLSGARALLLWLAGLSFFPCYAALVQGQLSIFVLAAMTVAFVSLRAGRNFLAGACLALVLIKPVYLVPVIIVLVARSRWRASAAFVATSLALTLVPLTVVGPDSIRSYLATLREASGWHTQAGGFSPVSNHNFWGFAHLLTSGTLATALQVVLSAAVIAVLAVCARKSREADGAFGLAVLSGILISPHVLLHDLSLLVLPASIGVRVTRTRLRWLVGVLGSG